MTALKKFVDEYKAAYDKGEDLSVYEAAIEALSEFHQNHQSDTNVNVVHAVHEFAHMLAADPQKFMQGTADDAVTVFFSSLNPEVILSGVEDPEKFSGQYIPETCENKTGPNFIRSLDSAASLDRVFELFAELRTVSILKKAITEAFADSDDSARDTHWCFDCAPLDGEASSVDFAASGETSGPVAHNDNGAEERN